MYVESHLLEAKPSFTAPLKDITVSEEESVTFECELSKPDQKVKWFKNGKEIKPDRKRGISTKIDGQKHSLIIPKTEMDDAAQYSVKYGEEETKGKLLVRGNLCTKDVLSFSLVLTYNVLTLLSYVLSHIHT